ncbi:MAG: MFS transporter [Clostridiales Family XIII bacterium]|jgi:MFS family permease|nr:MFS transporter [Clostridiales Family XIII bacterium]
MMETLNNSKPNLNLALDEYLKGRKLPAGLIAAMLLIGSLIGFAHNTSPAPFIPQMIDFFGLDSVRDQPLINASMSVIFASTVPASLFAAAIESRIGTRVLFTLAMLVTAIGVLMVFIPSDSYTLFLAGRIIYGVGFGFNIPALGSAFMKWFRPKGRQLMVTMNGVLPLLGALVSYAGLPIIGAAAGGDGGMSAGWQMGYGFTGFIVVVVFVVWFVGVRKNVDDINIAVEEERILGADSSEQGARNENPFKWAFKTNQIKCLLIAFICDFCMYMYIATIMPIWLINAGGMDEITANLWTAIAFPVFGVAGTIIGGVVMNVSGRRKPIIVLCQVIKLVGFIIACMGADSGSVWIIAGIALFGLGNGGWMPPLFLMPTEIRGSDSSKVATSYSILMSSGYIMGLISPILGGALSNGLIDASGITGETMQLAYGLKWSVFYLGLGHIVAIIASLKLKETGAKAGEENRISYSIAS